MSLPPLKVSTDSSVHIVQKTCIAMVLYILDHLA
jgi:hypothetical protein